MPALAAYIFGDRSVRGKYRMRAVAPSDAALVHLPILRCISSKLRMIYELRYVYLFEEWYNAVSDSLLLVLDKGGKCQMRERRPGVGKLRGLKRQDFLNEWTGWNPTFRFLSYNRNLGGSCAGSRLQGRYVLILRLRLNTGGKTGKEILLWMVQPK